MFFVALAIDYDGTLARNGRVDTATTDALSEVKKSGRKLILVTGRDLADLTNASRSLSCSILSLPKMADFSSTQSARKKPLSPKGH